MNKRQLIRIGLVAVLALVAYFQKGRFAATDSAPPAQAEVSSAPLLKENLDFGKPSKAPSAVEKAPSSSSPLVVRNMAIVDMNGKVAFRGDVDLAPTLERIKAGRRDSHENDGATFGNFEGKLPRKQQGYYKEYVVRTPNIRHAGPQRLIVGQGGEIYYTPDHYQSFRPIRR